VADNELRIVIKAIDMATETLRGIREGMEAVEGSSKEAAAGATELADAVDQQVVPAVDSAEASTFRLSRALMPLSFGLREVGLTGPATFLQMAASATGATIATDTMTVSVMGLEIALGPLVVIVAALIVALVGIIATVAAVSAASRFLGVSFRQALGEMGTTAAHKLHQSLEGLGQAVSALKSWVGNALVSAFGPALSKIAGFLTNLIMNIPNIMQSVINSIIGFLNSAGTRVVSWINAFIDGINLVLKAVNVVRGALGMSPLATIGKLAWKAIAPVTIAPIQMPISSMSSETKAETFMGGGGGGGGGTGGTGGAGTGAGKRLTSSTAPNAITDSAGVERLQLQQLEAVTGLMQQLLDAINKMPEAQRDAIVTYTGGAA
jgi:hypothetical protein